MLTDDLAERAPELTAAKNFIAITSNRVMDRTMSLLAAEGYETERSKARRGGPTLPVERFARDARGLRISGGVDFLLEYWTALEALPNARGADVPPVDSALDQPLDPVLSPRNQTHLARLRSDARALGELFRRLAERYGVAPVPQHQHQLVLAGRVGIMVLGTAVVLARAAHLAERGDALAQDLADLWCTKALGQVAGWWLQLDDEPEPDYAAISEQVLHTRNLDVLLRDAIGGSGR